MAGILSGSWAKATTTGQPCVIGDPKSAAKQLPRVHRAFANLKTWLLGAHHGVGARHLSHYAGEFVSRFDRRRTPVAAFQSLLGLATQHPPTTYQMSYAAEPAG
jgi:hypothetical protein